METHTSRDMTGVEQAWLDQLVQAPAFVKRAADAADLTALPDHVFADAVNRAYPMHTAAATWRSYREALAKQAALGNRGPLVEAQLRQAGVFFGIDRDLEEVKQAVDRSRADEIASLPDTHFGLVYDSVDGRQREYPLRNPSEVKVAGEYLVKFAAHFKFDDRREMATKILARAAATGAAISDVDETLVKLAGYGVCDVETAAAMLRERLPETRDPQQADSVRQLACAVESLPFLSQKTATEVARLVDDLDDRLGLKKLYRNGYSLPEETLFSVTAKLARAVAKSGVTTVTGKTYDLGELVDKVTWEKLAEWLGEEFADAVAFGVDLVDREKLAAIVPTMPRDEAQVFDRMAETLGLTTSADGTVKSASAFTEAGLRELLGS